MGLPVSQRLELWERYNARALDFDEALSWLAKAQGETVWFHLNKAYEVIHEGVGGVPPSAATQNLVATGWTAQAEIDAFTNSANTQSISGELARHARGTPKSAYDDAR